VNTNYTVSRHDATRKPKADFDEIKRRSQAVPLRLLFRAIKLPTSTGRLPPNCQAWTLSFVIRATSDVQVYRVSIRVPPTAIPSNATIFRFIIESSASRGHRLRHQRHRRLHVGCSRRREGGASVGLQEAAFPVRISSRVLSRWFTATVIYEPFGHCSVHEKVQKAEICRALPVRPAPGARPSSLRFTTRGIGCARARARAGGDLCLPSLGPSNERDRCRATVREGLSHGPLIKKRRNRRPGRDATSVALSSPPISFDFPLRKIAGGLLRSIVRLVGHAREYRARLSLSRARQDAETRGRKVDASVCLLKSSRPASLVSRNEIS